MKASSAVVGFSLKHPRAVIWSVVLVAAVFIVLALLPTLAPQAFPSLHPMTVDTDPENMLPEDEPVRAYHAQMKREMALYDMVVLGVVNEQHDDGVFNPGSLAKVYELTRYAKTLRWEDAESGDFAGVVEADIIAPSTVDNIEQAGPGTVRFEWLMAAPPSTREEALAVREKAGRIPFLNGTLLSEDGKALCLYLPLTSKNISYRVYAALQEKIAELGGPERYFITGLPVAEDIFGGQMFKQMAISAPIAMLIIFVLMLVFFRKLVLVVSPMVVALASIICTMGLLVVTGNTIHIMSSMIPIFIMPIAVLDGVHILSEFFDRYRETGDRAATVRSVMGTLFTPMLYTSLTTAVGFASLALTPIPPVQIFGLFIAFGVLVAWVLTVVFIPSFIMLVPPRRLEDFGAAVGAERDGSRSALGRLLSWAGQATCRRAKLVMMAVGVLVAVAAYGISRIQINDNPVRWFTPSHPIRVADSVLNKHFGGTYMAYLALEGTREEESLGVYAASLSGRATARGRELSAGIPPAEKVFSALAARGLELGGAVPGRESLLDELQSFAESGMDGAGDDDEADAWDEAIVFVDGERQRDELFKQPAALEYMAGLQEHLLTTGVVGKSNSVADIVKTVHRELVSGEAEEFLIPDSVAAVAQCLLTYQNGHRPQDLWHLVTPDYRKSVIWVQLKSGNNRDMTSVIDAMDRYISGNPPPLPMQHRWFGLTYINVVWQEKMVHGMLQAFLGSFLCVFLMMTILYRSALWGLLSMIPLTVTIGLIYGAVGLVGKDYDMPVAVLSSLSLGLAVDYAIHFLSRSRSLYERYGSWLKTVGPVFGEPARAIARNVVVVGVGFLPLLAAPLVPYQTVGVFIAAILFVSGVASLAILPSLISLLERWLFPTTGSRRMACRCATCAIASATAVALVAVSARRFLSGGWTQMTWLSVGAVIILWAACAVMSRRESCRSAPRRGQEGG